MRVADEDIPHGCESNPAPLIQSRDRPSFLFHILHFAFPRFRSGQISTLVRGS